MTFLLRQVLRFGTVGLVNTSIGLAAIYAAMFFFQTGPVIANGVGYAIGLIVSFLLNRWWTFRNKLPFGNLLPKYLLVAAICYLLNLGVVFVATSHLSANPYLAQLFGVSIYTTFMFIVCRRFVFAPLH